MGAGICCGGGPGGGPGMCAAGKTLIVCSGNRSFLRLAAMDARPIVFSRNRASIGSRSRTLSRLATIDATGKERH